MTCLLLFYEFFKTGLFAVGGGLATLPFLYDMAARHPEWFTVSQLADMLAVSESTPGPLGVNMATYVGYLTAGIPGAVVATIGLVTPSVIVILIVALAGVITSFSHLTWVQHAFAGIRVCVCVLIFNAVLKLWKSAVKDVWGLLIFLAVLAASLLTSLSPVWYVLAAGVAGVLIQNLKGAKK